MKKALGTILGLIIFSFMALYSYADNGTVEVGTASATESSVTVSGTATGVNAAVVVEVIDANGTSYGMGSLTVKDGAFSGTVSGLSLAAGNYTVRVADYDGGTWNSKAVTVEATTNNTTQNNTATTDEKSTSTATSTQAKSETVSTDSDNGSSQNSSEQTNSDANNGTTAKAGGSTAKAKATVTGSDNKATKADVKEVEATTTNKSEDSVESVDTTDETGLDEAVTEEKTETKPDDKSKDKSDAATSNVTETVSSSRGGWPKWATVALASAGGVGIVSAAVYLAIKRRDSLE